MKKSILLVSILSSLYLCGCQSEAERGKETLRKSSIKDSFIGFAQVYHLKAGGPNSITLITNAPDSNPVSISLVPQADEIPTFLVKNGEHHAILVWNVRVQVPSKGRGTDGFGWDTIADDYPDGQSHIAKGMSGKFSVQHPRETPWRVCVIYSTDWKDSGNKYWGNYEVISQPLTQ